MAAKVGVLGVCPGAVRAAKRPQLEEVPAPVLFQSTEQNNVATIWTMFEEPFRLEAFWTMLATMEGNTTTFGLRQ